MRHAKQIALLIILSLFQNILYSQSAIMNEQQAMNYLDQNYYDLETIEGIYDVDVSFTSPIILCSRCSYSEYTIKNYDKILIYKSNNKIYHYSFIKGKSTGIFNAIKTSKYWKTNQYSFKIEGINDGPRLSDITSDELTIYSDEFEISMPGKLKQIMNYFGYKIGKNLNIKCDDSGYDSNQLKELLDNEICYTYSVSFIYHRIFPPKEYTPSPQYEYGTGFAISTNPFQEVLTNYHVVKDYQKYYTNGKAELKVILPYSSSTPNEFNGTILWVDTLNDLVLIKIYDSTFKGFGSIPYKITGAANLGQNVFTLGYPLQDVMGQNIKLSTGTITGTNGINDYAYAYTLDLNLNPGNSGGPLFNNSGDVVGIVSARLNDDAMGVKVENVSYAIKAEKYLSSRNLKNKSPELPNSLKGLSLEQKIQKIKPFIVIIKVRGRY